MTLIVVFLLSCLSLVIWLVLLFGRGGFWRARAARRLPPDARGAAAGSASFRNPMICCSVKRFFMFVFFSENELY